MTPRIVSIVEGHGEVEALPVLLRRISAECTSPLIPKINPPIRVKAGSFLNDNEYFRRYLSLATAKAVQGNGNGLVLILLDCDDDCPAHLGPTILEKARQVRSDVSYLVTLAYREYETWFIAAAESLRGSYGLPMDLNMPADLNAIRGAKEWLSRRMSRKYDPLNHQAEFTNQFDLDLASRADSFRRFRTKIEAYLKEFNRGPIEPVLATTRI